MSMRLSGWLLGFVVVCVAGFAGCGSDPAAPPPDGNSNTAKELTSFGFRVANNPELAADVSATVAGSEITATVPAGTNVGALIATFATTGASVTVGGAAQVSGVSAASFVSPVTYRVTAVDGSTQDYTVTVTIAAVVAKALTDFRFLAGKNPALHASVTATINGTLIAATVPSGTNTSALVATFSTTGMSVAVAGAPQVSNTTANNFAGPLTYRVSGADGSTQDYTVIVTVAPRSAKAITDFGFRSADNPGLAASVNATIRGSAITATVPSGTDVTALIATFSTTGTSVTIAGTAQDSGTTANNFTGVVTYRVTAADGTTLDYRVTVSVASPSAKAITEYAFLSAGNASLIADVSATISGRAIAATVPAGTDVSALIATFATSGMTVTVAGTEQLSGVTANRFTSPVVYRVTAADGSTQDYTVTVTVAPRSAKAITSYAFLSADNPGLTADVSATITGAAIAATVPAGTNVSALVATFSTTGASVAIGGAAQVSGTTANAFAGTVTYRVTAADGSTQDYAVVVAVAAVSAKAITSYAFLSANNAGLRADVSATITGTAIAATVPSGTDVSALVATFSTTGVSVTVAGAAQVSGATANRFTAPVAYRVTAADGTSQIFTVTVTVAPASAKAITSYRFLSANNAGLDADITATITGTRIAATVPASVDLGALVATFSTTGASVTVAGLEQASGATANSFAGAVTYLVTASDGSTQSYVVTVTQLPAANHAITSFKFLAVNNPGLGRDVVATIAGSTITATVPNGTPITALVATFTTTGSFVIVIETTQVSGVTANNFTNPVTYQVFADNESSQDYTVSVTVEPASASGKEITDFRFLKAKNPALAADVVGTFDGTTISLGFRSEGSRAGLIATFSTTGATVSVGGVTQVSGTTPNDFLPKLTYRVTATDGSTQDYTAATFIFSLTAVEP